MHDPVALRRRLAEHAVTARYGVFVGVGGALVLIGVGLFAWALMQGQTARAWQLFLVGWLYFTGLAGGAVAIVAAISPYRASRDHARNTIGRFVEVYLECPLAI